MAAAETFRGWVKRKRDTNSHGIEMKNFTFRHLCLPYYRPPCCPPCLLRASCLSPVHLLHPPSRGIPPCAACKSKSDARLTSTDRSINALIIRSNPVNNAESTLLLAHTLFDENGEGPFEALEDERETPSPCQDPPASAFASLAAKSRG